MKKVNWKVYNEALGALQAQFTKWDGIRIFNRNFAQQGAPVRLGVQWASLGLKSPEEAAEYQTGFWTLPWRQSTSCITATWWTMREVISDAWIPYGDVRGQPALARGQLRAERL